MQQVQCTASQAARKVGELDELGCGTRARDEMACDAVSEDEVYHVVGDADVEYQRNDGRTRYERMMDDGRKLVVIVEDSTRTVKTVW
jgi:hypothetical protein